MKLLAALVGACFSMASYFVALEFVEEILGLDAEPAVRITVAILVFVGGFVTIAIATGGARDDEPG